MPATPTFGLPGMPSVGCPGVVCDLTARTRPCQWTILGGLRTPFGGRAGIFATLCESARAEFSDSLRGWRGPPPS